MSNIAKTTADLIPDVKITVGQTSINIPNVILSGIAHVEPAKPAEAKKEEPAKPAEAKKEEPAKPAEAKKEEPAKPAEVKKEEPAKPAEAKKEEPAKPVEVKKEEPKKVEPAKPAEVKKEEPAKPVEVKKEEPSKPAEVKKEEPAKPVEVKKEEPAKPAEAKKEEPKIAVCPSFPTQVKNELKEKFVKDYKLSDKQFDLVNDFFAKNSKDNKISIDSLKPVMVKALKDKPEVKANDEDIIRALKTVDSDNDGQISLNELVQLLLLLLSNSKNIQERMKSVINNISNGKFEAKDALKYGEMVMKFFNKKPQENKETQAKDSAAKKPDVNIDLNSFAADLSKQLESSAFVKF